MLLFQAPMTTITIVCLIWGHHISDAFLINIKKDERIGDLQRAIKTFKSNYFREADANDLNLWRINIPDNDDVALNLLTLKDDEKLFPGWDIADYFHKDPAKKFIHIII